MLEAASAFMASCRSEGTTATQARSPTLAISVLNTVAGLNPIASAACRPTDAALGS